MYSMAIFFVIGSSCRIVISETLRSGYGLDCERGRKGAKLHLHESSIICEFILRQGVLNRCSSCGPSLTNDYLGLRT